jgi:hypothetical protein
VATNKITSEALPQILDLGKKLNEKVGGIDANNLDNLNSRMTSYTLNSLTRLNNTLLFEKRRNSISVFIFLFYLFICALSFFGFFYRKSNLLLGLSIILLISLPLLVFFEGITASYYFFYADFCQSIHDSIYENKFPVADIGLGYLMSCFNAQTKSSLYSFAYEVDVVESQLKSGSITNLDYDSAASVEKSILFVKENYLNDLLGCKIVYDQVVSVEQKFCVNGIRWTQSLLSSYTWLFFIILLCAYAVNRLKPLVEKKKQEIEVNFYFNLVNAYE